MLARRQFIELRRRKLQLLEQSRVNRASVQHAGAALVPLAAWFDVGVDVARRTRSLWRVAANLNELLEPKKGNLSIASRILAGTTAAQSLILLLREFYEAKSK